MLGENDPACLDFDLACTVRLQQYDLQVKEVDAKRLAYEVCAMAFGKQETSDDSHAEQW